jgi:FtsP/CotA-like multicopper oxidase with cupredoxin domain
MTPYITLIAALQRLLLYLLMCLMVTIQVQTKRVTKLCNSKDIVTVNGMFPGPVIYAQEDDRIIVKVTNKTPFNVTIHW